MGVHLLRLRFELGPGLWIWTCSEMLNDVGEDRVSLPAGRATSYGYCSYQCGRIMSKAIKRIVNSREPLFLGE